MIELLSHFAQDLSVQLPNASPANSATIQKFLNIIFGIAGATALLVITLAGYKYVYSRGSAKEVETAKNAIVYAVIGLVVIISATVIVNFVVFKIQ
jgi:heme/copper-type cytochrome/quinol oxidase subunit 2